MNLFRDAKTLSSGAFLSTALVGLRAVLVLEVVGPTTIGVWKSVMVMYFVAEFARLGISRGIGLRLPVLTGQQRSEEAERYAAAAYLFLILVGALLGASIFAASFLAEDPRYRLALRLVAIVIMVAQPQQFLRELCAARKMFVVRAKEMIVGSLVDFVATLTLAYFFGLAGLGIGAILSALIPLLYLWRRLPVRVPLRFDLPRLRSLVRLGLPYSLMESVHDSSRHTAVFLLAVIAGPTLTGYFALSVLMLDFAQIVVQIGLGQVVKPHLLQEFGRAGSFKSAAEYFERPARLLSYALPPAIGAATFLLPGMIEKFLPKYVPGIEAAQVALWAVFFISLHSVVGPFIVAAGRVGVVLKISMLVAVSGSAIMAAVIWSGAGLAVLSAVVVATFAGITTAELWTARRQCGNGAAESVSFVSALYAPFCVALGVAALSSFLVGALAPALPAAELAVTALFLILYSPLLWAYESRFSLLRAVYLAR